MCECQTCGHALEITDNVLHCEVFPRERGLRFLQADL